jgi:predicted metal-binding membrane protein
MSEALPARKKWFIMSVFVMLTMAAWVLTFYPAHMAAGMSDMARSAPARHPNSPIAASSQGHRGMMMTDMPGMPMETETQHVASTTLVLEVILFLAMWLAMMIAMMSPSV